MRRTALLAALAVAAIVPPASTAQAPSPVRPAPLVPAHGAYLGLYYGSGTLARTARTIGRTPRVHLTYFGWEDDWARAGSTRSDLAAGRIPLVNWEPFGVDFDDVIAGRHDRLIAARADAAKALGRPFFLDFAAEMNEEEGWGGHDPARYVAAWRHIHDIFTARGATDVVWVWAPNSTSTRGAPGALAYYPGDRYVDWTGIDGYNWGTSEPGFGWQGVRRVFAPMYRRLATLGKPIIIGETASDEVGGSKAAWIDGIVPTLRDDLPLVKAVVWFDVRKERRWQLRSSPGATRAFRRLAADPYLRPPAPPRTPRPTPTGS